MLVDSGWNQRSMYVEYMGMGDVSRYAGTMSGAAPHYGMPSGKIRLQRTHTLHHTHTHTHWQDGLKAS